MAKEDQDVGEEALSVLQRRGQKKVANSGDSATGIGRPQHDVLGHPDPTIDYPKYPGFTLWLAEEFNEPLDLDTDPIWTWSDGGLVEGQIRFVKEAIMFEDGLMKIEVSNRLHAKVQQCSHAEVAQIGPKQLTSGEFRAKHNMFRYGRYEARLKAPSVQPDNPLINGNFISTLFVFRDAKYKHWREIDFEITGDSAGSVTTNVLSADNTAKWKAGIQESSKHVLAGNVRENFHTYAFEWLPDRITWFVDGVKIREKHPSRVPVPDLPGKIMMNLWIFDKNALFGGSKIGNNRYPFHSEYDWFRFYRWDGEKTYPCEGAGTSCLSADDMYLSSNNPCDGIEQVGTVYGKVPCQAACA